MAEEKKGQEKRERQHLEGYTNPRLPGKIQAVIMIDENYKVDLQAIDVAPKQLLKCLEVFLIELMWENIKGETLAAIMNKIEEQVKGIQLAGMSLPPDFDPKNIARG